MNPETTLQPASRPASEPDSGLHSLGRRAFCALACAATALAALPLGADPLAAEQPQDSRRQTADTRASLGKNAIKDYRKQGGFFLIAEASGIYAVTAICTHHGCTVHLEEDKGFECPCHDSAYDLQGNVTQGPAKLPLKHFEVTESSPGGPLVVDLKKVVDSHVRF